MSEDNFDVFVREGEEEIRALNRDLLALEDDPDDTEVMDDIFRSAHTLKGNFAAMGFADASDLAHAVEDVLDAMREDEIPVTTESIDLAFDGIDRLEAGLGDIDETGTFDQPTDGLIAELRSHLETALAGADGPGEDATDETETDSGHAPDDVDDTAETGAADWPVAGDGGLLAGVDPHDVRSALDDPDAVEGVAPGALLRVHLGDPSLPGAEGMLTMEKLSEEFEILGTVPAPDAVHDGEFDEHFDVFVAAAPETVVDYAEHVQPVSDAAAVSLGAGGSAPSADADPETAGSDTGAEETDADTPAEAGPAAETAAEPDETDATATDGPEPDAEAGQTVEAAPDTEPADDVEAGSDEAEPAAADTGGPSLDGIKSVKVDVDQLDELYGQVEQLVTSRIRLRKTIEEAGIDAGQDLDELDKTTASLQDTVMDMRLVPMDKVVGQFPRVVRDLSQDQGKNVSLELSGTDVELDRTILDRLRDPLIHVLRNAVDHGIEPPEERAAADKPETGTVELAARRERDRVLVEVSDDGRGLDVGAIREQALETGIRSEPELDRMSDEETYDLVFHPGFSTTEEVTDVSGRGVGMDVVHNTVTQLDGSVDVQSTPGEGTTVTLELPVSVAIVKVLFVTVDGLTYGVPIKKIDTVDRFGGAETINGQEFVEHDDDLVPLVRLGEALDVDAATLTGDGDGTQTARADGGTVADDAVTARGGGGGHGMVIRVTKNERPVALHCDGVDDQEEVVVKPLEGILSGTEGLSGTAVLGEGNVVPILDVMTI